MCDMLLVSLSGASATGSLVSFCLFDSAPGDGMMHTYYVISHCKILIELCYFAWCLKFNLRSGNKCCMLVMLKLQFNVAILVLIKAAL